MFRNHSIAIAAAAAVFASAANAEDQHVIATQGHDLDNPWQVSQLYLKIVETAEDLCGRAEYSGVYARLPKSRQMRNCMKRTVRNTIHAANIPALKTAHDALPRDRRYAVTSEREITLALAGR